MHSFLNWSLRHSQPDSGKNTFVCCKVILSRWLRLGARMERVISTLALELFDRVPGLDLLSWPHVLLYFSTRRAGVNAPPKCMDLVGDPSRAGEMQIHDLKGNFSPRGLPDLPAAATCATDLHRMLSLTEEPHSVATLFGEIYNDDNMMRRTDVKSQAQTPGNLTLNGVGFRSNFLQTARRLGTKSLKWKRHSARNDPTGLGNLLTPCCNHPKNLTALFVGFRDAPRNWSFPAYVVRYGVLLFLASMHGNDFVKGQQAWHVAGGRVQGEPKQLFSDWFHRKR